MRVIRTARTLNRKHDIVTSVGELGVLYWMTGSDVDTDRLIVVSFSVYFLSVSFEIFGLKSATNHRQTIVQI